MPMHSHDHRAWIEVNMGALLRNASTLAHRSGARLLAMVKADAYGLGAQPIVAALEQLNPWGYGVATLEEGALLRDAGIARPIVVFTPARPSELDDLRANALSPALGDEGIISAWCEVAGYPWQLSIETGMNRAGIRPERLPAVREHLQKSPPAGAFTHFHSPELNDGSMDEQESRFRSALQLLPSVPGLLHTENSAAVARRGLSNWNLIRPGIFLYGIGSGATAAIQPEPVVSIHARVVELHRIEPGESVSYDATFLTSGPRTIATTALGYADGYRRLFSNTGEARINGHAASVVGVVTMDMTMLDVTDIPCKVGDLATFAGTPPEAQSLERMALAAGLSPYECLAALRLRLPRVYALEEGNHR